jgi:nucleotide-binding universal stress UspA family protein
MGHDQRPVVVGTDGSPGATAAVRFAADQAAATSSALRILTSTGDRGPNGDRARDADAAQGVADAARQLVLRTHPGLSVTTVVEHGRAEGALVDASAAAHLVVVGTRGHGPSRGMLPGSVSHAVIHGAHSPVAVIGPDPSFQDAEPRALAAAARPLTGAGPAALDVVDVWGHGSFPASDPPANW